MSSSFNIYVATVTQTAEKLTANPALLAGLGAKGVKPSELQEIVAQGREAYQADRAQLAARQRLEVDQRALEGLLAQIEQGIERILMLKPLLLEELSRAPEVAPEDVIFVRDLSFGAPPRARKEKPKYPRKVSRAQNARRLQLSSLLEGIEARPKVAAAFTERGLDAAAREELMMAALLLPEAREAHAAAYKAWLEAGARERAAVLAQRKAWARVRPFVRKLAGSDTSAALLLSDLARAREQAKTGGKRPRKKKAAPATTPASA